MSEQEKIREIDLVVPALRYIVESPGQSITTTELRERLKALFQPSGINLMPIGRGEPAFDQIVRNIVSNRNVGNNMIHRGFASYDETTRAIAMTEKGRSLLNDIGYQSDKG